MKPRPSSTSVLPLLLVHLESEETLLRQFLSGLEASHDSLRAGEPAAIETARACLAGLETTGNIIQIDRANLFRQLASELHIPLNQINLSRIMAMTAGDTAESLRGFQQRLSILVADVRAAHERCASLLGWCRVYVNRLLHEVAPAEQAGPRYGPRGGAIGTVGSTRILARG